jgi:dihydrolipoamide dehydrogenase
MTEHDLAVIGAGPGGYVAAIRAAQLGLDVACIDREERLGGTCLRVGCIPSKALLESSLLYAEARTGLDEHGIRADNVRVDLTALMQRKEKVVASLTRGIDGLFKKHGVHRYTGEASLAGPDRVFVRSDGDRSELKARHVLVATGSRPSGLKNVEIDGRHVTTSTEALSYEAVPEHLIVIGAGYIGLEMASIWSRLGAKVTVLEVLDRVLPGMDPDLARDARKLFEKQGIRFLLECRVRGAGVEGDRCVVECEDGDPIEGDRVLVATGRAPVTEGLGLEEVGVKLDQDGRIAVDEHFSSSVDGVRAIGDVIRGPMLAHKAEEEGIACVEHIVDGTGHVDYQAIPGVVYTHPEIASVGSSEARLEEEGVDYRKGIFPLRANGRARAMGQTEGWVKVLADRSTDRILGVHILGARAGDLIAEAAVAISFGASSEDLARCSHAHPSLAEALKEAALAVDGRAIHF